MRDLRISGTTFARKTTKVSTGLTSAENIVMDALPSLEMEDLEELSRIWYEHQFSETEQLGVQEKFYRLVERIFEAKSMRTQIGEKRMTSNTLQKNDRRLLIERLLLMFQRDRNLASSLESQCLELLRSNR
jgi:hypothetical protein